MSDFIFPESKRVIYEKCTLIKSICQVRFAPILRINTQSPDMFQEQIRNEFPIYKPMIVNNQTIQIGNISGDGSNFSLANNISTVHKFIDSNEKNEIELNQNSLSLTTDKYKNWEEFSKAFSIALDKFKDEYSPTFFNRIGLRFQNVISRKDLDISKKSWSELIRPELLGVIAAEKTVAKRIKAFANVSEISLGDEKSVLKMQISLVRKNDIKAEECLMLDYDYSFSYNLQDIDEVINKLDYLHKCSKRVLRWSITDLLHETMVPNEVNDEE